MADDLTPEQTAVPPAGPSRHQPSLARVQAVPWLIVIALLALSTWLGWKAFFDQTKGDPVASAMLAFQKQNSLTVFSSRFEVVAESANVTSLGPLELARSRQAAIIPATVEYRLDLASVDRDRFHWDSGTGTLAVVLPPLRISRPNLDEAQSKVFTEGVWVTRKAALNLSRENSRKAELEAVAFARDPQIVAMARQAAKEAVAQNLAIPLQVAGYGEVKVSVRFDGEKL